jgi:hypothetical protein
MHNKMGIVFISLCAVVLAGCAQTTRIGDFTIISSKNIDLSKGANFKRGTNRVMGKDLVHSGGGFAGPMAPNMKTAIDRAIESVPGTVALVDGVISQVAGSFSFGYMVEGTPLIDPSLLENSIPTPKLDRRGRPITESSTPAATQPAPSK